MNGQNKLECFILQTIQMILMELTSFLGSFLGYEENKMLSIRSLESTWT
jgi:hypothetical protein